MRVPIIGNPQPIVKKVLEVIGLLGATAVSVAQRPDQVPFIDRSPHLPGHDSEEVISETPCCH